MTTQLKRLAVTVLGNKVRVVVRPTEDGYECKFDASRNHADSPADVITSGRGETEAAAVKDYVRECHHRNELGGDIY
jgi:hypothetical protein